MIQYRIWTEKHAELFQTKLDNMKQDLESTYGSWQKNEGSYTNCFICTITKKERDELLKVVASIIGDIIQEDVLKKFAKAYLNNYKGLRREEKKEVERLFIHSNYIAKEEGVSYIAYYVIYTPLIKELQRYKQVNIDGWINFRTQKYKTILEDVIEQTIYDFEMQKDYIQFINFLLETKAMQETKEQTIHLIPKINGEIILLDEQKENQTQKYINVYCEELDEQALKVEDKILHILISISPEKLVIHEAVSKLNPQFLETIKALFKDQITYCTGCKACKDMM